jgi:O-antigen/teichoic acid export membrane protein
MKDNGRVIKNLLLVFSSEGIGGILSFAIVLLSARLLGVEDFGVFSYILAITAVCQLIADFGLTSLIVRELAKQKDRAKYIMSNVMSLAWVLSIVILLVVVIVAYLTLEHTHEFIAAVLMGFAVLATYHSVVFSSVCRAFERMGYNAFSFVTHKIILLGLVLFFAGEYSPFESTIIGIATAYMIANFMQYLFFFVVVRTRFVRFGFGRDLGFCFKLLTQAIPIGISMVIRRMTSHVGVLLLTSMSTTVSVGIFSSALKVIQMVDMIPHAFILPLFPAMSRLANGDRAELKKFFFTALTGFLIISVPLSGYIIISAENLVSLLYGSDYLMAGSALEILGIATVGLFVNMLLSYFFIALNKQRFYMLSAAACLVVNIIVCVILIPEMAELGAAYGTLAGEVTYFLLCVFFLKHLGFNFAWLSNIWRPIGLTALAALICSYIPATGLTWQLLVTLVFAVVYVPGLFLTKVIKISDIRQVLEAIKPKQKRQQESESSAISGVK